MRARERIPKQGSLVRYSGNTIIVILNVSWLSSFFRSAPSSRDAFLGGFKDRFQTGSANGSLLLVTPQRGMSVLERMLDSIHFKKISFDV